MTDPRKLSGFTDRNGWHVTAGDRVIYVHGDAEVARGRLLEALQDGDADVEWDNKHLYPTNVKWRDLFLETGWFWRNRPWVPTIPRIPESERKRVARNDDVIAICGECHREVRRVEMYSCPERWCPVTPKGVL